MYIRWLDRLGLFGVGTYLAEPYALILNQQLQTGF